MDDAESSPIASLLERLREWVLGAQLPEDGRLPPERVLAADFGVSRAEARKALAALEFEGLVERHVGRGTFRTSGAAAPSGEAGALGRHLDLRRLVEHTSPHEAMVARLAIEPELTSLAAINAAPRQLAEAAALASAMRSADRWSDYERMDARFHELIAEAASNSLLLELHRIINAVRLQTVWARLDTSDVGPPPDYHSFQEHDAIVAALERRDRSAAHAAMSAHLKSILQEMIFDERPGAARSTPSRRDDVDNAKAQ